MRKIMALVLLAGLCATAVAGEGTDAFKVLMLGTEGDPGSGALRPLIVNNSGGQITAVDYQNVQSGTGWTFRRPDSLFALGYKAIITFGGNGFAGGAAPFGDTLAKFMDLGGGVVNMTYTFHGNGVWAIAGRYSTQYMAVPYGVGYGGYTCALGTIYQPGHPIMSGVSAIGGATGQGYHTAIRATRATRIADWNTGSYIQCAAFDSIGKRTVTLNYHPQNYAAMTGQWLQQLVNALVWTATPSLAHDVSPTARVKPGLWVPPVATPCSVVVSNLGLNPESNIPVYCVITDSATGLPVYSSNNVYVGPLAAGASVKVGMPTPGPQHQCL